MPLASGTIVGPYVVGASLGAGGMGEVYRARDTKLKRDVAVKVLHEISPTDGERKLRFEREAELLASLNHPNIAHLYGLEDTGGVHALVMELVEGATLAERIAQGPIALEEAVMLARQIVDGMEYAHERGIIHRDLKPANIKVTPDGQVKILDFGLAKALAGDIGEGDIATSPTISVAATSAGVLLGTAGYMSPEQAKGKSVDRRADIWAFGCVLYEMLTGKPAFDGETITDKLAAVVRAEPELSQLPEKTPQRIRELLQRCLIKDPKQRLQAIGEARIALDKWLADRRDDGPARAPAHSERIKWVWVRGAVALISTIAAIAFGWIVRNGTPSERQEVRAYIKPGASESLALSGTTSGFALSPDGRRLAYVANTSDGKSMLWLRPMNSTLAQPLPGTDGANSPFWSPDSRFVGFYAGGKLKKIDASGGPPVVLCDAGEGRGGSWSRAGVILFTPDRFSAIYRVSAAGGPATPVTTLDRSKNERAHRWPNFLPDGRHFLYVAGGPSTPKENPTNAIMVGALDSNESKTLFSNYTNAVYALGYLLFLRQHTLMAQPFDAKRLEFKGDPIPIADPVISDESRIHGLFSASENGVLTYVEGSSGHDRQLVWVDRSGKQVGEVAGGADSYADPQISPDGKRVLIALESGESDLWIYDVMRAVKTRLTFGSALSQSNMAGVWSRDGRQVAYTSVRSGKYAICQKATDGSGKEEIVVSGMTSAYLNDWSPDGKLIAYLTSKQAGAPAETWILPLADPSKPYPFLQSDFHQVAARFSPDGKYLAHVSTESGRPEVYVVPFPGPGGKSQVSMRGGFWPRWRRDGKEIYFISPDNKVMAAEVSPSGGRLEVGTVHALFETRLYRSSGSPFDVTGDGQRFLINRWEPSSSIMLIENWDAELKKK
jgi:eukaryotic-like serine/threonine-protein kinase